MAIGTYVSPIYWQVSSIIPSVLLGVVIFFTGLSMDIDSIKEMRNKKKVLLFATILKWTLTVFISLGLAYLFFYDEPELAAGLILSGTVPSATAATLYTFLAGGTTSLVIAASLLDVAISPVVTPLALLGFSTGNVTISFIDLLRSFIFIVIVPIGLGLFLQQRAKALSIHALSLTKFGSSMSLLLIIHTLVGNGKEGIASQLSHFPLVLLATFIQVVLPMILAYVIAKALSMKEEDARATMFQVGLCNTALAAIIANEFIGEVGAIPAIINMIINLSVGAALANRLAKEKKVEKPIDEKVVK